MKSILIIDDAKSDRMLMRNILKDYEIAEAETGKEGIEIIKKINIDLVLVDQNMAGKDDIIYMMNGIETIIEIQNIKPGLKCIMITGNESVKLAVKAFKAGAIDFAVKPVNPVELRSLVERNF